MEFYDKMFTKLIVVSFFGFGGMDMEKMGREEILAMYRPDVEKLAQFLPWLREKTGDDVAKRYEAKGEMQILNFPVYDTTLLNFIKALETTVFMNRNYRYVYSKYRILDWQDELKCINSADIMTMDIISGILSKYVLGGKSKAYLWKEAMDYHIFFEALEKANSIIAFWDVPIQNGEGAGKPADRQTGFSLIVSNDL